jgi:hypothetical protein
MGCVTEDGLRQWDVKQKTVYDYGPCNRRRITNMGCVTEDAL